MDRHYYNLKYLITRRNGKTIPYYSVVEATEDTIDKIIDERGIGESRDFTLERIGWKNSKDLVSDNWSQTMVSSFCPLSMKIERENHISFHHIHYACYLGFLAISSGQVSPAEILGDGGLLHELIHSYGLQEGELIEFEKISSGTLDTKARDYKMLTKEELIEFCKEIENKLSGLVQNENLLFKLDEALIKKDNDETITNSTDNNSPEQNR